MGIVRAGACGAAIAAAFLLGVTASPAAAADAAELACPAAALSEEQRSAMETMSNDPTRRKAAVTAGGRAVADCARRFGWSERERTAASHYLPASLARERFRRVLTAAGLDAARIERDVVADRALIDAAATRRPNPPELTAHLMRLAEAEAAWLERNGSPENAQALGGFVSATALAEGARINFTRD